MRAVVLASSRWCSIDSPVSWISFGFTVLILLHIGPVAYAQSNKNTQVRDRQARVNQEFTEVRSGPAESYSSRGRLYLNDRITVRANPNDAVWVEVIRGGPAGYVRLSHVSILDFKLNARSDSGRLSPGLDKRLKAYRYDKNGRRVDESGRRVGSGEGTAQPDPADESIEPPVYDTFPTFVLKGFVGVAQLKRAFGSNVDRRSFLRQAFLKPYGVYSSIEAHWNALRYLMVMASLSDARLAESTVRHPSLAQGQTIPLSLDMQNVALGAMGRYPLGPIWFGLTTQLRLFRRATQEVKPAPIQINLMDWGADVGAAIGGRWKSLSADVALGVFLPLSTSQSPLKGGQPSGRGHWIKTGANLALTQRFALCLKIEYIATTTDFAGLSDVIDSLTDENVELRYDVAQQKDSLFGLSVGVSWAID